MKSSHAILKHLQERRDRVSEL